MGYSFYMDVISNFINHASCSVKQYEPPHHKTNKMTMRPAKTQISLGITPVWSESSLCTQWVAKDPNFLHADSKDSDQTGRMPRLIWVFAERTVTLLVLSRSGSYDNVMLSMTKVQMKFTMYSQINVYQSLITLTISAHDILPHFKFFHTGFHPILNQTQHIHNPTNPYDLFCYYSSWFKIRTKVPGGKSWMISELQTLN